MKCIAALVVDLERSPLGTRSRLADDLHGVPVLRRTMDRLTRAKRIDAIHLLTPPEQLQRVKYLIDTPEAQCSNPNAPLVTIEPTRLSPAPYADLVRAGRWWGLNSWRGGISGLCSFDEDFNAATLAALARRTDAEIVVCVPAAAAMLDPVLTDSMIAHLEQNAGDYRFTFCQSPPGMTPLVVARSLIEHLAPSNEPIGLLLAYNPDRPFPDLTGKEPCYRPRAEVVEASGRLICDTNRSFDRVRDLIVSGAESWGAPQVGTWLQGRAATHVETSPAEIEIELVAETADGPASRLRSSTAQFSIRPSGFAPRGPLSLDAIRQICDAIRETDDTLIVLGGHGDPLDHPALDEICRMLRPGAASIAVRTFARIATPHVEDALFEIPVDVIEVMLDAATPETYRRLHGVDAFDDVMSRMEGWLNRREKARRARPLIVPSFVKCRVNLDEMEAFYATWQKRLGMALITGHTDYAGQQPNGSVTSMAPPNRTPCRRTFSRMMVLANGDVTTCDQDFKCKQTLGNLTDKPLIELWQSPRLTKIRASDYSNAPLCPSCSEWHRP